MNEFATPRMMFNLNPMQERTGPGIAVCACGQSHWISLEWDVFVACCHTCACGHAWWEMDKPTKASLRLEGHTPTDEPETFQNRMATKDYRPKVRDCSHDSLGEQEYDGMVEVHFKQNDFSPIMLADRYRVKLRECLDCHNLVSPKAS